MSVFEDIFLSTESTEALRITSAALLTVISIMGVILNIIVLLVFIFRIKNRDGFLKICCLKSFGNSIVCIGYMVWPVPVTFLNHYFLPHIFNAFMGQLVGWFAWCIGPFSQVLLTSNRILAVFLPHMYNKTYRLAPSNIGIIVCLLFSFSLFAAFFPEGCHFLYNLQYIGWLSEDTTCSSVRRIIFLVSMFTIVIFTTICGVLLFLKLIADSEKQNDESTVYKSPSAASKSALTSITSKWPHTCGHIKRQCLRDSTTAQLPIVTV